MFKYNNEIGSTSIFASEPYHSSVSHATQHAQEGVEVVRKVAMFFGLQTVGVQSPYCPVQRRATSQYVRAERLVVSYL